MDIHLKYIHPSLCIGLEDLRHAWLLSEPPVPMPVTVHQGQLSYRLPKKGDRISYRQLKAGLKKCNRTLHIDAPPLPFNRRPPDKPLPLR